MSHRDRTFPRPRQTPLKQVRAGWRSHAIPFLEARSRWASLYTVVLILATQRPEYQLAQLREQLTLELAILSEQLLEESRGNPLIRDRVDQGSRGYGSACRPTIGARRDQGNSRRGGADRSADTSSAGYTRDVMSCQRLCVAAGHSKCGATFKLCGDVHVEQKQTLKIPREAGFYADCGAKRPDEDYRLQSSSVYCPEACGNAAALRSPT